MSAELVLLTLIPLVLFVIVEIKFGLKIGVYAAIATAIATVIYFFFRSGEIDPLLIAEVVLLVILGLLTVKFMNDRFIKFQPVVMAALLTGYIAYLQWADTPVMIRVAELGKVFDPRVAAFLENEVAKRFLEALSGDLIYLFIAHGLLVLIAALKFNNFIWLLARLAIYPMMFVFMTVEFVRFPEAAATIQEMLNR